MLLEQIFEITDTLRVYHGNRNFQNLCFLLGITLIQRIDICRSLQISGVSKENLYPKLFIQVEKEEVIN